MEQSKLSKEAYGSVSGHDYQPYVRNKDKSKDSIVIVVVVGILLAILFAASNVYTAITAGMTVAAGIPGAILGGGLLAIITKKSSVINTNMLQGMSSAGESIASGITYVLPALFILGADVGFLQGFIVGVGGALLGIGVTSIVHNYLIIEEHGKLIYPEGMAISETVVSTVAGGDGLKTMGIGFGIGSIFVIISNQITGLIQTTFNVSGNDVYKWQWQTDANPLLLGIGYIVGLEVAGMMLAGTLLANFAIIPLIGYFSAHVDPTMSAWNDSTLLLRDMTASDIQATYTKYIGAGMMLAGGVIGAIKLIPAIVSSVKAVFGGVKESGNDGKDNMGIILLVALVIIFAVGFMATSTITMAIVSILLIVIFSFLFSIVSARMTGTIGTSNLPVSGMTIASLLIITVVFVMFGWNDEASKYAILMSLTAVVTAIAISGGYAQSQKATFILGGSRNKMQLYFTIAAIVGVAISVLTIFLLKDLIINTPTAAPQANLMASIVDGVLTGNLPWTIIAVGVVMAIVLFIMELPIMTVAIGFYLPVGTVSIIFIGAIIKVLIQKLTKDKDELELKEEKGTIFSSGLIAGGAIIGLLGAFLAVINGGDATANPFYIGGDSYVLSGNEFSLIVIFTLALVSFLFINKKPKKDNK